MPSPTSMAFDDVAGELWLLRISAFKAYAVTEAGWTAERAATVANGLGIFNEQILNLAEELKLTNMEKADIALFSRQCAKYGDSIMVASGGEEAKEKLLQYAEWHSLVGSTPRPGTVKYDRLPAPYSVREFYQSFLKQPVAPSYRLLRANLPDCDQG